jgi:REP element-mobilizing transposase RayT
MVRWYHLIITAYGFWLPNDPRGSWSDFVGAWELRKFGPATKVSGKRSYARDPHDVALRFAAMQALKYPAVRFDDAQREAVARGLADAVGEAQYQVHAGCIGHDHAHLVVGRHRQAVEQVARHLKSKATMAMTRAGVHPLARYRTRQGTIPTPWAEGAWSVFIEDAKQLGAAIAYVQRHPLKEGLPMQKWGFVTPAVKPASMPAG